MQKPKIECIYLDMDGVLCDFEKRYKEMYHMEPADARDNHQFDHFFDRFIADRQFETLDLMPGAMFGVHFLRKCSAPIQILSSTASEERYDAISKQKMIWLQKHGIPFHPIFVPGKKHKYKYATPNSIIIDDTKSVIDDWKAAGGIAIWHKDWTTTLSIISMYV